MRIQRSPHYVDGLAKVSYCMRADSKGCAWKPAERHQPGSMSGPGPEPRETETHVDHDGPGLGFSSELESSKKWICAHLCPKRCFWFGHSVFAKKCVKTNTCTGATRKKHL